ncbi:MAG: AI-2E family transporter [Microscillaceae bacterium]|nr:AI-2E family transporter [Microscillaceae bacterium]
MGQESESHPSNVYLAIPAILGIGFMLHIAQSFMVPFVVAVLLAILFAPFQVFLRRKGVPSVLGSLIIFVIIFSVFTILGFCLYGSIRSVLANSNKYAEKFNFILVQIADFAKTRLDYDLEKHIWNSENGQILTFISPESVFETIEASLGSFVGFFSNLLTMLLFLMFMLLSRETLKRKIYEFLNSQRVEDQAGRLMLNSIVEQIQDYLWLKSLISISTGFSVWLAAIILGLDFAIVWGFLAFLLNFIPSIGPILAAIPPILLAVFQYFDYLGWALLIAIVMVLIQFISGNIVEPKLMGDRLNLNILVVLLCLFVWGMIWGFVGMILSVPLTASLNIIFNNSRRYRHISILLSN